MWAVSELRSEGWPLTYLVDGQPRQLPAAVQDVLSLRDGVGVVALKVWPVPGILAIFRPYEAAQIDFDVDLRELQGQQQLDALCRFLMAIGRKLGKPVLMTPEGADNDPVLGYDVAADRLPRGDVRPDDRAAIQGQPPHGPGCVDVGVAAATQGNAGTGLEAGPVQAGDRRHPAR